MRHGDLDCPQDRALDLVHARDRKRTPESIGIEIAAASAALVLACMLAACGGNHTPTPTSTPDPERSGAAAPYTCTQDSDCPHPSCGPCQRGEVVDHSHDDMGCVVNPCPNVSVACEQQVCVVR